MNKQILDYAICVRCIALQVIHQTWVALSKRWPFWMLSMVTLLEAGKSNGGNSHEEVVRIVEEAHTCTNQASRSQ